MSSIPNYMTEKHRECDDYFINAEKAVSKDDWQQANQDWQAFRNELALHLEAEEEILFPQFEQATGMTTGPTQVMRMEHQQMRALVTDLTQALLAKNKEEYLGLSETLLALMQQHNMKEEMMLYPMSQQQIQNSDEVTQLLQQHCEEKVSQ